MPPVNPGFKPDALKDLKLKMYNLGGGAVQP